MTSSQPAEALLLEAARPCCRSASAPGCGQQRRADAETSQRGRRQQAHTSEYTLNTAHTHTHTSQRQTEAARGETLTCCTFRNRQPRGVSTAGVNWGAAERVSGEKRVVVFWDGVSNWLSHCRTVVCTHYLSILLLFGINISLFTIIHVGYKTNEGCLSHSFPSRLGGVQREPVTGPINKHAALLPSVLYWTVPPFHTGHWCVRRESPVMKQTTCAMKSRGFNVEGEAGVST